MIKAYIDLLRLRQPVGILLLFWPCAWGVLLASEGHVDRHVLQLLALFALGAALMRPAGCIINDLTDRKFDAQVARTQNRPLASGALTLTHALIMLASLLFFALGVALLLGMQVLLWALAAMPLVVAYPWMKRITYWPQAFLGLTFNWGALLGWMAVTGTIELPAVLLYMTGICWTLYYDTIYAHQDKEDDALIGVKSTALKLKEKTPLFLIAMSVVMLCLLFKLGGMVGAGRLYFAAVLVFFGALQIQIRTLNLQNSAQCLYHFKLHGLLAGLVALACILA